MTAKDIFSLKKLPKSLTIIGAGAIGIEFAYFFNAFGTKITLLEAQKNIYQMKMWKYLNGCIKF